MHRMSARSNNTATRSCLSKFILTPEKQLEECFVTLQRLSQSLGFLRANAITELHKISARSNHTPANNDFSRFELTSKFSWDNVVFSFRDSAVDCESHH